MKNRVFILIFILSFCKSARTQNLVSNGNFEMYSQCPNLYSQINYVISWHGSGISTPDYFNACAPYSSGLNVPYTSVGYERDYSNGQGYAGIICFNKSYPNRDREYLQTQLIDTLKTGKKYLASMYANLCNNCDYAIGSLGMVFTNSLIQGGSNNSVIPITPHVKNIIPLSDTLNWILIQDTIVMDSNAINITIGNFFSDSLSDTTHVGGALSGGAYYLIDGISIYDISSSTCNNYWDAGFNKHIVAGDSIRLGAINTDNSVYTWQNSLGGATYLSSNTDGRPWSTPNITTTYYVFFIRSHI